MRCIQISQLFRPNDLLSIVNQVIESIRENLRVGYILLGYGVLQGHGHPPPL